MSDSWAGIVTLYGYREIVAHKTPWEAVEDASKRKSTYAVVAFAHGVIWSCADCRRVTETHPETRGNVIAWFNSPQAAIDLAETGWLPR